MSDQRGNWPIWNDVVNFLDNIFGWKVKAESTINEVENDYYLIKFSKKESVTVEMKEKEKPIMTYADVTEQAVGISGNIKDASHSIGLGKNGFSVENEIMIKKILYAFKCEDTIKTLTLSYSYEVDGLKKSYSIEIDRLRLIPILAPKAFPIKTYTSYGQTAGAY